MPKKTGSLEGLYHNMKIVRAFVKEELGQEELSPEARKKLSNLDNYGAIIGNYIRLQDKADAERAKGWQTEDKLVNFHSIETLLKGYGEVDLDEIFTKKEENWKYTESTRKAMEKFTKLLMDNELKKFQYFQAMCNTNEFAAATMKDIMSWPLPKAREADKDDPKRLKQNLGRMIQRLKQADSALHRDSGEFKDMKKALIELYKITQKGNPSKDDIGRGLEKLHDATMRYIKEKGVGMQGSKLGKARMDTALDICGLSADFMDVFASPERIKEVLNVEKQVGARLTKENGVYKYRRDGVYKHDFNAYLEKDEAELKEPELNDPEESLSL